MADLGNGCRLSEKGALEAASPRDLNESREGESKQNRDKKEQNVWETGLAQRESSLESWMSFGRKDGKREVDLRKEASGAERGPEKASSHVDVVFMDVG